MHAPSQRMQCVSRQADEVWAYPNFATRSKYLALRDAKTINTHDGVTSRHRSSSVSRTLDANLDPAMQPGTSSRPARASHNDAHASAVGSVIKALTVDHPKSPSRRAVVSIIDGSEPAPLSSAGSVIKAERTRPSMSGVKNRSFCAGDATLPRGTCSLRPVRRR